MIKTTFILLILVCPAMATTIDIYYPNNNTTTDIYYSIGNNYTHVISNNISGDLTSIILKDEIGYDNIIESPHKAIKPLFKLILFVILLIMGIIILTTFKKVF
jgi:hypothetical protein